MPSNQETVVARLSIKLQLCIGVATVLTAAAGPILFRDAQAAVVPVDWTAASPTVTKLADLPDHPGERRFECVNTTIEVYRSATSFPKETYCMVPTATGIQDVDGKVLQPAGYNKAYPLEPYFTGGNPVIIPIRNQAAALEMRGHPTSAGVTYNLYRNVFTHMRFDFSLGGPKFKLVDAPEIPFNYSGDNRIMQFNPFTLAVSNNGQYFLVDTVNSGFVKVDLLNLGRQPVAVSLPRDSSGGLLRASTAIDDSGAFAAIAYGSPGGWGTPYFKVVNTKTCNDPFSANSGTPPTISCASIDLRPKLQQEIPDLLEVINVRFVNDRTITFVAVKRDAAGVRSYASYSIVAGGQARSLVNYLALGDSYISGEGAFSYRQGTDTERNRCHQSTLSYPYLLSAYASSFASVACSGARSQHVLETDAADSFQVYGTGPTESELNSSMQFRLPGYHSQYNFVKQDNPDVVTISMGGNDIGFGDILNECVNPFANLQESWATDATCYSTYEDRLEVINTINSRLPKLRALYETLRNGGDKTRRVYVVGYPQVAKVGGNCGANVQMNYHEIELAHDLIEYLNSVIRQAAVEAGVLYIDTESAFNGARLCEGNGYLSAMNGLTVTKTNWGGYSVSESFHPNKRGHELLAQVVAAQTDNLTKQMPVPAAVQPAPMPQPTMKLLRDAPASGRTVYKVEHLDRSDFVVQKGASFGLLVNGQASFVKPNSSFNAVLHSTPVNLGAYVSNAQGDLAVSAVIPANTEPGFHTLHLYGNDIFGNPIDLRRSFYVAANADDYDGDGIANDNDACALVAQSGIDIDVDNIDDACDPLIGPAPITPPEPEGIIWREDAVLSIDIQSAPIAGSQ